MGFATGLAAAGSILQGVAGSNAANYQAAVARNNAAIAQQNAQLAITRGREMENASRQQSAQTMGHAVAAASASGLDANTGSPLRLQSDIARLGELDALTIRANAARQAYGYQVTGMNYSAQAGLDEAASGAYAAGGLMRAGGQLGGVNWGSIIGDASATSGAAAP